MVWTVSEAPNSYISIMPALFDAKTAGILAAYGETVV